MVHVSLSAAALHFCLTVFFLFFVLPLRSMCWLQQGARLVLLRHHPTDGSYVLTQGASDAGGAASIHQVSVAPLARNSGGSATRNELVDGHAHGAPNGLSSSWICEHCTTSSANQVICFCSSCWPSRKPKQKREREKE